jgi:hypothetical protein
VHALIKTRIPYTLHHMRRSLPGALVGVVHTCPQACLEYITGQLTGVLHAWPTGTDMGVFRGGGTYFQTFTQSGVRNLTRPALERCIGEETPWWVMKRYAQNLPRRAKLTLRTASHRVAMRAPSLVHPVEWATDGAHVDRILMDLTRMYGMKCVWDGGRPLDTWTGEPVVMCSDNTQRTRVLNLRLPNVAFIVTLGP